MYIDRFADFESLAVHRKVKIKMVKNIYFYFLSNVINISKVLKKKNILNILKVLNKK